MGNIYAVTNDEGYNCIRIMKNTSVLELQNLCTKIEGELKEQGYFEAIVDIDICHFFVVLDINMSTEECDEIGTVEFMTEEDISTEYYELLPIGTSPQSDEWTQTAWEEYSEKVFDVIIEMLSE